MIVIYEPVVRCCSMSPQSPPCVACCGPDREGGGSVLQMRTRLGNDGISGVETTGEGTLHSSG